jgi:thiol-disulfide isomerase/thioredoxin
MNFKANFCCLRFKNIFFLFVLIGLSLTRETRSQKTPQTNPPATWQSLIVPETADPSVLELFINETKKRQPINQEQYVEMQRALRTAAKKLVETIEDKDSVSFKRAEAEFVNASVMLLGNDGEDAQRKTFERFRDYFKERPKVEFTDIQMAMLAGHNLEQLADYQLAKEAYRTFAEVFREKNDPSIAAIISMFESNARRLDLPGKKFQLKCSTISGDDFDIDSLQGKYVLIYFWASISKPCELEHPYMVSIYNKYKSKGFEIVGIGLDEQKDDALAFIRKLEMPWINLWESRSEGVSKVMEAFGVNATPTSFLLDKEGKVITIEARGLLLGKALANLLPDVAIQPASNPPEKKP